MEHRRSVPPDATRIHGSRFASRRRRAQTPSHERPKIRYTMAASLRTGQNSPTPRPLRPRSRRRRYRCDFIRRGEAGEPAPKRRAPRYAAFDGAKPGRRPDRAVVRRPHPPRRAASRTWLVAVATGIVARCRHRSHGWRAGGEYSPTTSVRPGLAGRLRSPLNARHAGRSGRVSPAPGRRAATVVRPNRGGVPAAYWVYSGAGTPMSAASRSPSGRRRCLARADPLGICGWGPPNRDLDQARRAHQEVDRRQRP
jgi:hypothetical protein